MYVEFVRGKYSAENKQYIIDILNGDSGRTRIATILYIHLTVDHGVNLHLKCCGGRIHGYQNVSETFIDGVHGYTLVDLIGEIDYHSAERMGGSCRNIRESDESNVHA
jgi:hypothetical protein